MTAPRILVILPAYNEALNIARAVADIRAQLSAGRYPGRR